MRKEDRDENDVYFILDKIVRFADEFKEGKMGAFEMGCFCTHLMWGADKLAAYRVRWNEVFVELVDQAKGELPALKDVHNKLKEG